MKKFLSALTAFCMGASMVASTLPASALTPILSDVTKAQADGHTWDISDSVMDDERIAYVDVTVENDPGTLGYAFGILINDPESGEWVTLPAFGIEIADIYTGDAYTITGDFAPNYDEGSVAFACTSTTEPEAAKSGGTAVTFALIIPETVADGVYDLKFSDVSQVTSSPEVGMLSPEWTQGTLTVGTPPETTTTSATTTEDEGDATQPPSGNAHTWDIDDSVMDEERIAYINVNVENDPGTLGYAIGILINDPESGEWVTLPAFGIEIADIYAGDAYTITGDFAPNYDEGSVAFACTSTTTPEVGKNGGTVVTFAVIIPETVPNGVYDLKFSDVSQVTSSPEVGMLDPVWSQGTLTVGAVETTTTETTPVDNDHIWDIDDSVMDAERIAYVNVTVTGDPGTLGYAIGILINDPESGEWVTLPAFGIEIADIYAGDAYTITGDFAPNYDEGSVAFACTSTTTPEVGKDGGTVVTFAVIIPETVPNGVYDLKFSDVSQVTSSPEVGMLNPVWSQGTLTVGVVETTTTTEATTTTTTTSTSTTTVVTTTESSFVGVTSEIDAEWVIGTVEADAGETVTVSVTVTGDVDGINSYLAEIGNASGPEATGAEAGDAYSALEFVSNLDAMTFGATNYSLDQNVIAEDGAVVFNMTFMVPADAAPGTVYDLTFDGLELYDIDMVQLIPTKTNGWIKVREVETTEFEHKSSEIDAEWAIGTVEAEAGKTVTVPVTVTGDVTGINSYILDMGQDAGPVAQSAEAGDAYAALEFVPNMSELKFAGTNYTLDQNVIAEDGAIVFNVTFTVPADAAPGTVYDLTFESLELYDIDMVQLIPKQTNGWIKVPPAATTNDPGEWIIGTTEVEAGATVTIPVTVKGDLNGINSYILDMGQDAGPVAQSAEAGDAYAALEFVTNIDALTFAGTNYTLDANVIPTYDENGEAVVMNVTFQVPADAEPGTIYNLTFEELDVYDINMSALTPVQTPGWIKIFDATESETSTTESETTTTESTTTTTETTTTTTTTETTTTTTEVTTNEAGQWIIGTTEVAAGATVTIPVTVKGDSNGINSYIFDMGQDAGPVASAAEAGNAYAALEFVQNLDTLTFAGTNYTLDANVIPTYDENGEAVVMYVTFTVPADAEPGTIYNLTFENLEVYDINMSELTPVQTPGWIKIFDATTTESTTTESTTTESETTMTTDVTVTDTTPSNASQGDESETTTTETTTTETTTTETTESTTTETTTAEPVPGSATWQIATVEAQPGATVTVDVTVTGDTGLNIYEFGMLVDAGPVALEAAAGNAYPTLEMWSNLQDAAALRFGATAAVTNVVAEDGAVVLTVTFQVPEDAETGQIYNLTFDGDVEAYDIDGVALDITEVPGWIRVIAPDVTITGYEYEVTGQHQFYFSHDPRNFDPADLVETVTRYTLYSDGTKGEAEVITDFSNVQFNVAGWTNPEEVFNAQVLDETGAVKEGYFAYYRGAIPATITDEFGEHELGDVGEAYIAVKGDATLDGSADAKDAAIVLMYAAKVGAGVEDAYIYVDRATDQLLEDFAYFLADVTGESEDHGATDSLGNAVSDCDAKDAAKILVYAAIVGSGLEADWAEILSEPLPKYTAAIAEHKAANPAA